MMEMVSQPPSWWSAALSTAGWGLVALILAVTIMAEWLLWMIFGSVYLGTTGIALGGVMTALQIWLLFGTATVERSCDLPR